MRIGTDEVIGDEYVVEDVRDDDNDHGRLRKRKSRFTLLAGELGLDSSRRGFNKEKFFDGITSGCSPPGLFIHPQNRIAYILVIFLKQIQEHDVKDKLQLDVRVKKMEQWVQNLDGC
ncbi:STELAR K+ outward rectifier [Artemisia annua]|uniref:STELAR K+ outward rectifier n=1 Tax=Artemisia annua TaxID=35608 RepID=A0A2U1PJ36_ARTAN|nr:STELAR K+ outward rectifier [Artemisia annua]